MTSSTRPPNQPPTPPPPSGPKPPAPPPSGMTDNLMALADTLGFQTPARCSPMGARSATASVRPEESGGPVDVPGAEGPGCKGRVDGAVGAATFTLPPTAAPPSFDDEPLPTWATSDSWTQFFEVNVCGGLDVDEVGPSHCGSYVPHRWHDMTQHGTPIF